MHRIAKLLADRFWRLNNLYYIIDKEDNKVILHLNAAQKLLFNITHNKTIIPKSRQRGISTYKVAEALDRCIFTENAQNGIQSYGNLETKKLYRKAIVMWDNFDPDLKDLLEIKLISSNQEGMFFSNGSTLRIGNFRGDTLSSLHVSELAKIAIKSPEKARELKTGAFQAVSIHSKISIESTAEGAQGIFFELCMRAKALQDAGAPLTPLDFKLVFLGWKEDPDCVLDSPPYIPENKQHIVMAAEQYFKKHPDLTQTQKNWYIAKKIELGEDMGQEYPATLEEAFAQSVEGTILKHQYNSLIAENRLQPSLFKPQYPVTASYDIGVNDETVIHFTQLQNGKPMLVNTYVNSKVGIPHYVKVFEELNRKGYQIVDVILPHDGKVQSFSTGKTRLQTFRDAGIPARIIPRTSEMDGVEALRQLLDVLWIDSALEKTITAIQLYRWKVDRQLDVTLQIPEHDWTSNYMKSLQYMAQGWDYNTIIIKNNNYSGV